VRRGKFTLLELMADSAVKGGFRELSRNRFAMKTPLECRALAVECRNLAISLTGTPRSEALKMAEVWEDLAREGERRQSGMDELRKGSQDIGMLEPQQLGPRQGQQPNASGAN
jgi:hypothetical protein